MEHPEQKLQEKLRKFLASRLKPEIVWMASANGGYRDPHTAISLKSMGVLPGAPDLCFCLDNGRTGWIELKAPGGKLSPQQKGVAARLIRLNHFWGCAHSIKEAVDIMKPWNVFKAEADLNEPPEIEETEA